MASTISHRFLADSAFFFSTPLSIFALAGYLEASRIALQIVAVNSCGKKKTVASTGLIYERYPLILLPSSALT
jgi:hypothetical protein